LEEMMAYKVLAMVVSITFLCRKDDPAREELSVALLPELF